jgi:chemotaxis family two-component system response regulator Rcp1
MTAIQILLVEDNPGDVRLSSEAFKGSSLPHALYVVPDGVEAMCFVRQATVYTQAPRPDIIILDLNLPRKNGLEVLDEIRADQELKDIPIIILTSSDNDLDVLIAYRKQANAYLVKPSDLSQYDEVINAVVALCH